MSGTDERPKNRSIQAVLAAYGLALAPHGYYVVKTMAHDPGVTSNILPRDNLSALKGKIPAGVWDKLARARGAHMNAMEGFPFFAAATLVGNVTKMPVSDLNTLALNYLGARVLYTALYMGVRSERMAYLRTAAWAWSISVPVYIFYRAGNTALTMRDD
ncbi:hypothetical protein N7468_008037 [Penicillium chermesinum]|uniref:Uncharacterized protein n=1 Tax=Penicillium chermesinum TaxID=63820 RepID=A0A9W9NNY6_9EURO|nr:uncharacterized protein N7468_008037 [Penicillium chermesinum]KAJ5223495.1 hypothetical protein N7468_008037 [Penicillium chermesinum]KAJ6155673.1 hypothetical protein N7470_006239 [Penicillium chermesinum]